jgi:hypothetical protein
LSNGVGKVINRVLERASGDQKYFRVELSGRQLLLCYIAVKRISPRPATNGPLLCHATVTTTTDGVVISDSMLYLPTVPRLFFFPLIPALPFGYFGYR